MFTEILHVWSESPALSVAIWLVIAITLLYLGRPHAHELLRSTGGALYRAMRMAALSLRGLESRLENRNREVLLAQGREAAEKAIEREFQRVNTIVERDLGYYPALHRELSEVLEKVEEDYRHCTDQAPLPPAWTEVMETLHSLPTSGDPAVNKVLENIRQVIENAHRETLRAYQKGLKERHAILNRMQPQWRALRGGMEQVQQTVTGLEEHSRSIDRHMEQYESIRRGEDRAVNALTSSSMTQFFISGLVLVIAAFGGLINFQLIALPMSEMVGGSQLGGFAMSDIAALVIIMVEISMGLFFLEALGITKLFPAIHNLSDRARKRMAIAAFTILVAFATIESSLAWLRDMLVMDSQALSQSLAGGAVVEQQFRWIPTMGQVALSFILPFALAFVGIPLESFIHSLRTVLGVVAVALLRAVRVGLRIVGGMAAHLSRMLVSLYDLFIMLPLSLERLVRYHRETAPPASVREGDQGEEGDSREYREDTGAELAARRV